MYYPPIARVARSYGLGVVKSGQGISFAQIRTQVSRGHPAIVWVDYLWRHKKTRSYRAYDSRLIPYAWPAEHAVVVSKVARGRVPVNDSARGRYWATNSAFKAGYATYTHMAAIIRLMASPGSARTHRATKGGDGVMDERESAAEHEESPTGVDGRSTERGRKPRSRARRTRPVRLTVDLDPALHRRLKQWTGNAAVELDVVDLSLAEVFRALVRRLTVDQALAAAVLKDLRDRWGDTAGDDDSSES